jgi:hypothetical protein
MIVLIAIGATEVIACYQTFLGKHFGNRGHSNYQPTAYTKNKTLITLQGCALDIVYHRRGTRTLYNIVYSRRIGYGAEFP